jgi:transcriptional regulator with XRE-family HTH domain
MTKLMALGKRKPAREPLHYTACGLDDVYLVNGFTREQIDGEDAVTIEDMDGLWNAIGLSLVCGRKALAPKEVRFLRSHMELTQAELGDMLRVTDQTVARWEKGETPISGPADLLLRVLFLASKCAQPEGGKMLDQLRSMLEELRDHDEPERPAPITFRHSKKWEREKPRQSLEYA